MRRADRLFRLVQLLRDGRLHTARRLAEALEVSERTVYRDIRDLQSSGLGIDGAAGVGYLLRDFDLPPLMFNHAEIEALVLGARMAQAWGGSRQAMAAGDALAKIEAALPPDLARRVDATRFYAPDFHIDAEQRRRLDMLGEAVHGQRLVQLAYRRPDNGETSRLVRPLALHFWGGVWTLGAWCELRDDFRNFRIDRMVEAIMLDRKFASQPGQTLEDFLRRVGAA